MNDDAPAAPALIDYQLPAWSDVPAGGFRVVYDAVADVLSIDFHGVALPAVSVPVDRGDRDYLYLRVDPARHEVVGLEVEDFLSYAVLQDPAMVGVLAVAELPDLDDIEATKLRNVGVAAATLVAWNPRDLLAEVDVRVA